ncbi:MAG: polysaccharide deacetylase family protein [Bacteroidales bacterium]|jgi:hypothetical protein|nr:polysaccharide deacetylase family protein [Bacteroidales bacterium]
MLTVYTSKITSRIIFTLNVILKEHLSISFQLTDSKSAFQSAPTPKFSYDSQPVTDELFLWRHSIMLEDHISLQEIRISEYESEKVFFQVPREDSFLPFDIFGMTFYLLTRYEEYLPYQKDRYGRFPATESLAYKAGFLEKPLIDILVLKFAEKLKNIFPELPYQTGAFKYVATYDIDNAYAFKHKGFLRTFGGLCKSLLKLNFKETRYRLSVLNDKSPDPFDNYDFMESLHERYHIEAYFFILFAPKSKHDRGLSPSNKALHCLIRRLSEKNIVGIHPSFVAHFNDKRLSKETILLGKKLNAPITHARSHFLLLDFPKTYQSYIESGITNDFTMGYADQTGFRASTSKPFPFFDLTCNEETKLIVHPFAYMDAALMSYLKKSPEEASELIHLLLQYVKSVNGIFISLWHNDNLGESNANEWRKLYQKFLIFSKSFE